MPFSLPQNPAQPRDSPRDLCAEGPNFLPSGELGQVGAAGAGMASGLGDATARSSPMVPKLWVGSQNGVVASADRVTEVGGGLQVGSEGPC